MTTTKTRKKISGQSAAQLAAKEIKSLEKQTRGFWENEQTTRITARVDVKGFIPSLKRLIGIQTRQTKTFESANDLKRENNVRGIEAITEGSSATGMMNYDQDRSDEAEITLERKETGLTRFWNALSDKISKFYRSTLDNVRQLKKTATIDHTAINKALEQTARMLPYMAATAAAHTTMSDEFGEEAAAPSAAANETTEPRVRPHVVAGNTATAGSAKGTNPHQYRQAETEAPAAAAA